MDCSYEFGNKGCNGGTLKYAYEYVEKAGGLNREEDYPYISSFTRRSSDTCFYNAQNAIGKIRGMIKIPSGDEEALKEALYLHGPISIAIHTKLYSFWFYNGGIYDYHGCKSDIDHMDHGVLLVGYGEEDGIPYWIIKNSWGHMWGENGYIRIRRGRNICGVATQAIFPRMY